MDTQLGNIKKLLKHLTVLNKEPNYYAPIFYCEKVALESIRKVFKNPSLIVVLSGRVDICVGSNRYSLTPGEMLALPATEVYFIGKKPNDGRVSWVTITFKADVLRSFKDLYGKLLIGLDYSAPPQTRISSSIADVIYQWLLLNKSNLPSKYIAMHRQLELLLLLAEHGVGKSIFFADESSWKHKITQLVMIDPGAGWNIKDLSCRLGVSVATLRRRLKEEDYSFQGLLEEVRLESGYNLLKKTTWKIGRISQEVGYPSQSRFSERFKLRYGINPSEVRKKRLEQAEQESLVETKSLGTVEKIAI